MESMIYSLPLLNVLDEDLIERIVEQQNFVTASMKLLNEYTLGENGSILAHIREVEDLDFRYPFSISPPAVILRGTHLLLSLLPVLEILTRMTKSEQVHIRSIILTYLIQRSAVTLIG